VSGYFWYVGAGVCLELLLKGVRYQFGSVFGRKDKAVRAGQWMGCWTFVEEAFV